MCDGDITSYMNQLFRTHEVVSDFKLRRDSTRWGVMERTVPTVYYVFVPPWVHARIVHPLRTFAALAPGPQDSSSLIPPHDQESRPQTEPQEELADAQRDISVSVTTGVPRPLSRIDL
jgi:hypothetical protein